jgi:hypothetical protein
MAAAPKDLANAASKAKDLNQVNQVEDALEKRMAELKQKLAMAEAVAAAAPAVPVVHAPPPAHVEVAPTPAVMAPPVYEQHAHVAEPAPLMEGGMREADVDAANKAAAELGFDDDAPLPTANGTDVLMHAA